MMDVCHRDCRIKSRKFVFGCDRLESSATMAMSDSSHVGWESSWMMGSCLSALIFSS